VLIQSNILILISYHSVAQSNKVQNHLRLSTYPSGSKLQLLLLLPHLNGNGYIIVVDEEESGKSSKCVIEYSFLYQL
jgi:hypothetical protein